MITEADVEEYRRRHFPESLSRMYEPGFGGRPMPVPSDNYVAELAHSCFHEWFGRACDDSCPHLQHERAIGATPLPVARVVLVRRKP